MNQDNQNEIIINSDTGEPETSTELVPVETPTTSIQEEDTATYGRVLKRSTICTVCNHPQYREINLMRARDHMPLDEISRLMLVSVDALRIHFKNHYMISESNSRIIALREDASPEANELVRKIFDKEIDLFSGAQSVLESKAERLNAIRSRMQLLTDRQEIDALDDIETAEFISLNKLAEETENSVLKAYQIIDKKLFPMKKEELSNAILQYKLNILSKMLDQIQIVFLEFESNAQFKPLIDELRRALASRFNQIEDEILKSGGIMQQNQ